MAQKGSISPTRRPYTTPADRPLTRLAAVGPAALSDAELVALVLGAGNTHLAQQVLAACGDLINLLRYDSDRLTAVPGIGPAQAARLRAAAELGRRIMRPPSNKPAAVRSPSEAANFLLPDMMHLEQEHLRVLVLDSRNHVLEAPTIYVGSLNATAIRTAEVFRPAVIRNAAAIIVAHNHPSGDASPSPEDVRVTRLLAQTGRQLDIDLLDHLIIGRQEWCSLKERGLGFDGDAPPYLRDKETQYESQGPAVPRVRPGPHILKAWYSATSDGRLVCHRCQAVIEWGDIDKHTAACWPRAGQPY